MTRERCKRFSHLYAWLGVNLGLNKLDYIIKQTKQEKKKD